MLRLSTNELTEIFYNFEISFNLLIFIVLFFILSIIRIRRKTKNKEETTNISIDLSQ